MRGTWKVGLESYEGHNVIWAQPHGTGPIDNLTVVGEVVIQALLPTVLSSLLPVVLSLLIPPYCLITVSSIRCT